MPITAALSDGSRVKARTWDLPEWREMVGSKDRPDMWCPFCEGPMHPKTSVSGLQFFAHNPGGPDCRFNIGRGGAESALHMHLKDYLTAAIDEVAGWEGLPEHRVDVDGRHYVADVYASRTDGKPARPGVFEVQLSRQSDGEVLDRHAIRDASGAVTTWITKAEVPWFRRVPTVRVELLETGRVQVIDGVMATDTTKAPATLLERFVSRVLAGRFTFVDTVGIIGRGDWVERPAGTRTYTGRSSGGSDACDRVPVAPQPVRPRAVTTSTPMWSMSIPPDRVAQPDETPCGWLGCPAPAERRIVLPSGADWRPTACTNHAQALAEHYGATVEVLA